MTPSRPTGLQNFILPVLILLSLSFAVSAADKEAVQTNSDPSDVSAEQSGEAIEAIEAEKKEQSAFLDWVEREKERTENQGNRAAQWVDSFFRDPAYEAEAAYSQVRVRLELYCRREQGLKPKIKLRFRFRLPNMERNFSLVGGSTDLNSDFDSAVDDDVSEPAIGLQLFGKEREKWGSSISVGIKFNEFAGFLGPRFRYRTELTPRTSFRFVQKFLWQTNREWQIRSRFDWNFAVNQRYFFRQMVDGRWRGEYSDEEGYRTRVSSFLTRRLANAAGLQS